LAEFDELTTTILKTRKTPVQESVLIDSSVEGVVLAISQTPGGSIQTVLTPEQARELSEELQVRANEVELERKLQWCKDK